MLGNRGVYRPHDRASKVGSKILADPMGPTATG